MQKKMMDFTWMQIQNLITFVVNMMRIIDDGCNKQIDAKEDDGLRMDARLGFDHFGVLEML